MPLKIKFTKPMFFSALVMTKWACSPAYSFVPTAAASCTSSDTRRTSASRTVISAEATRNAPPTAQRTLSALTS